MAVLSIILLVLFVLVALFLIFLVSIQSEDDSGLGGIFGGESGRSWSLRIACARIFFTIPYAIRLFITFTIQVLSAESATKART